MLVPNPAARLETFMFDNVPVDRIGLKVRIHCFDESYLTIDT